MTLWRNGAPTSEGVYVYTYGDCWVLAYYIAKYLNSEVLLIGAPTWGHAVAHVPGTELNLDIEGLQTEEQLLNHPSDYTWRGSNYIEAIKPKDFNIYAKDISVGQGYSIRDLNLQGFGYSHTTHRRMAKRLIAKYLGE